MPRIDETYDASWLDEKPDSDAMRQANASRLMYTGKYRLMATHARADLASERSPWPGRKMVHLRFEVRDPKTGDRKGSLFVDVSHEAMRRSSEDARWDGPTSLYAQLARSLALPNDAEPRAIIESVTKYPVDAYIVESYQTDKGWRTVREGEATTRTEYQKSGYTGKNFVRNFSPTK